eukprot:scaffold10274_cov106-Isochrysis_galbana.AAC.2
MENGKGERGSDRTAMDRGSSAESPLQFVWRAGRGVQHRQASRARCVGSTACHPTAHLCDERASSSKR